jgi:transposase
VAATWSWKAVAQFAADRFDQRLSRSSCLRYLHRLGFVCKRPGKQLAKADPTARATFVAEYAGLEQVAAEVGASIWYVDEALFRAEADLHGVWTPKGEPALVASTSPRKGEKAVYYSAVCPATGEVEVAPIATTSCSATTVAFLEQLRARHPEPLIVIWDNSPVHGGAALRSYLTTPDLRLHLVRLPAYSPDYNADEAIWKWVRAEVTANTCHGTRAALVDAIERFFAGLAERRDEVTQRCRTRLDSAAEHLRQEHPEQIPHVDLTWVSL